MTAKVSAALESKIDRAGAVVARIDHRARQRIVGTTYRLIDNAAARYGPRSQAASAWSTRSRKRL